MRFLSQLLLPLNATPEQGLTPTEGRIPSQDNGHPALPDRAPQRAGPTPKARLTQPSPSLVSVKLLLCLYSQQQQQKVKKVKPVFLFCRVKALIQQNS